MKDKTLELKVCEVCGSLWLRSAGQGTYCRNCQMKAGRLPKRSRRHHGRLRQVYGVACEVRAPEPAIEPVMEIPRGMPKRPPAPELAFYRKYTEALLRRYLRMSTECGRTPSLLGREMFRGNVTHYRVSSFEDGIIFCQDVEKCTAKLDRREQELVRRIALQQYTQAETAAVLGLSLRHVLRAYGHALDRLTEFFLERGLLQPLKAAA